jgi:hypothetical protein
MKYIQSENYFNQLGKLKDHAAVEVFNKNESAF